MCTFHATKRVQICLKKFVPVKWNPTEKDNSGYTLGHCEDLNANLHPTVKETSGYTLGHYEDPNANLQLIFSSIYETTVSARIRPDETPKYQKKNL